MFLADMSIGTLIAPIGIYLMFGLGSIEGMAAVAIQSLLSRTINENESGKIFALVGCLEQLFATIRALLYGWLFKYTIDWYPSLSFQLCATINVVPLIVFMWIDLTRNANTDKVDEQNAYNNNNDVQGV